MEFYFFNLQCGKEMVKKDEWNASAGPKKIKYHKIDYFLCYADSISENV